ncbi:MAG: Fe-S cluster assembly protein NifU [Elusimicrobiales bacterium]|nr:Fe-S cluster assembly protein NifU [Elusimicrobiales bacterium]
MWDYTMKVQDHFRHPRNVGNIPDANAVGEVGNMVCGDALKLYLKVDEKTRKILDAKFETFGCASAIASSSALTEVVKGMTLEEAAKVTNQQIAEYLGGLPEEKMHCSVMGMEALEAAIKSYGAGGKPVTHEEPEGKVICKCFGVTEEKIRKTVAENRLRTVADVTNFTKAGGGCGKCKGEIQRILDDMLGNKPSAAPPEAFSQLTMVRKIHAVEEALAREIAPNLLADGGSIELVDIQGSVIKVRLAGMCRSCPSSGVTLKSFVEKKLRELLDPAITVEQAE